MKPIQPHLKYSKHREYRTYIIENVENGYRSNGKTISCTKLKISFFFFFFFFKNFFYRELMYLVIFVVRRLPRKKKIVADSGYLPCHDCLKFVICNWEFIIHEVNLLTFLSKKTCCGVKDYRLNVLEMI